MTCMDAVCGMRAWGWYGTKMQEVAEAVRQSRRRGSGWGGATENRELLRANELE